MSARGLLVLALLAAVAILAVFWLDRPEETTADKPPSPALLDVKASDVARVELSGPAETIVLERREDGWVLGGPAPADADPGQVDGLLESLREARVARVVEEDASDLARYGLDPPARRLVVATSGAPAPAEIRLGRSSPVAWQRYVGLGPRRVVLVDGSVGTALERTAASFREMRLIPLDSGRIRRIEIADPSSRLVLERVGTDWWVREPFADRADLDLAERIARAVSALRFESTEAAPAGGFGPSRRLAVRDGADRPEAVAEVATSGRGGLRLARRERGSVWGRVAESSAQALEGDPEALRERHLASFSLSQVREIAWTRGGATSIVRRDDEGAPWLLRGGPGEGKKADAARIEGLLDAVRALRLETPATPRRRQERDARLVVTGADGPLVTLDFGAIDGGGRWAASDWRPGIAGPLAAAAWDGLVAATGALAP